MIIGLVGAYTAGGLFLSSFFLCRTLPIATTRTSTLVSTWIAASLVMGALWSALMLEVLRQLGRWYPALAPYGEMSLL